MVNFNVADYHTVLIATFLIFRFITGFCGSAFLSVAGGSVSDLFSDATVTRYGSITNAKSGRSFSETSPMALYTVSPFLGPVLGPLLGG